MNKVNKVFDVDRRIMFEQSNIHVSDDGIEHYPLFAAAFITDMCRGCSEVHRIPTHEEWTDSSSDVIHVVLTSKCMDYTAENLAGRMTTLTLIHDREHDEENLDEVRKHYTRFVKMWLRIRK